MKHLKLITVLATNGDNWKKLAVKAKTTDAAIELFVHHMDTENARGFGDRHGMDSFGSDLTEEEVAARAADIANPVCHDFALDLTTVKEIEYVSNEDKEHLLDVGTDIVRVAAGVFESKAAMAMKIAALEEVIKSDELHWLHTAIQTLKERGPAEDDEDPMSWWEMVDEAERYRGRLRAAIGEAVAPIRTQAKIERTRIREPIASDPEGWWW